MDLEQWFTLQHAHELASKAYNERVKLVKSERERGNWGLDVHEEYDALHKARHLAEVASLELYRTMRQERGS